MNNDLEMDELLDSIKLDNNWKKLASTVTEKDYRQIVSFDNCTSYSQLGELHACPRKFQHIKSDAKTEATGSGEQNNLDFAFGHSVGAGVQTLITTNNLTAGLFAAFISWKADYYADLDEIAARFGKRTRKCKSLAYAQLAVEKFATSGLSRDWEIYRLPSGKPAMELAFCVDMENGYQHYGHIDIILRNRNTGRIAVWEFKTTGAYDPDEAFYANSSQGLGYGVILDYLEPELADYDVIYAVYSSSNMEWNILPFTKNLTHKAEWLQDILLDHNNIQTYRKLGFFPKRGENCINKFGRRCQYFGTCDLTTHIKYVDLPPERHAENVDFTITKTQIIESQRKRLENLG